MSRYSERLPWSTPDNAYSSLLREQRRSGNLLFDLTNANPTVALAGYPHGEIAEAYGKIADFRYEPDAFGAMPARQAVAEWYAVQGIPVAQDRIALTASTSEAYSLLFKLLCDPGDQVLIPNPSYPLFEYLARAEGVRTRPYQLVYGDGWFVDLDSVKRSISSRTKAIVIVNPNNPTGSFLSQAEVTELAQLAAAHGLALISDEVFMTYPADAKKAQVRSLIGLDGVLSFSLNGLSKAAGMPQMKLGWMVVNGPQEEVVPAMDKLELLLDSYLSVGTPVQRVLRDLLRIGVDIHAKIAAQLRQNRRELRTLGVSGVEVLASEGGWSAILQVPRVRTEEEWIATLLGAHGVIVQPGYFYDMEREAYLVVSLLGSPESFAAGISRLGELAGEG